MKFEHKTVLLKETIDGLAVKSNGNYIDATLGGGGHAYQILKKNSPKGLLLGIDQDPAALAAAGSRLSEYGSRVILRQGNFKSLKQIANDANFNKINGIVLDLGVSSYQLQDATRGFSFTVGGPLDMRMGEGTVTAADVVNTYSAEELEKIFREYGEERFSRSLANAIVKDREKKEFVTSEDLRDLVLNVYKNKPRPKNIHPATKVFQAIRIEVNQELQVLKDVLTDALDILEPGGRLSIISFHSLEDRIVKEFFNQNSIKEKRNKYSKSEAKKGKLTIINNKPITASAKELDENPRARSAKLRIAEKN